jgi:hypothetical protein
MLLLWDGTCIRDGIEKFDDHSIPESSLAEQFLWSLRTRDRKPNNNECKMSTASKITLAATSLACVGIVLGVHYGQQAERAV